MAIILFINMVNITSNNKVQTRLIKGAEAEAKRVKK